MGIRQVSRLGRVPEELARLAHGSPEVFRVLFGPARLLGEVRLQQHAPLGKQVAAQIEKQGAHALRADVNGEENVVAHGAHGSTGHV